MTASSSAVACACTGHYEHVARVIKEISKSNPKGEWLPSAAWGVQGGLTKHTSGCHTKCCRLSCMVWQGDSGVCHSVKAKVACSFRHCALAMSQAHVGGSSSKADAAPWACCCGHRQARYLASRRPVSSAYSLSPSMLGCSQRVYQSPCMHAGESAGLRAPPMFHASFVLHGATLRTDKGPTQSFCEHTGRWTGPAAKVHS